MNTATNDNKPKYSRGVVRIKHRRPDTSIVTEYLPDGSARANLHVVDRRLDKLAERGIITDDMRDAGLRLIHLHRKADRNVKTRHGIEYVSDPHENDLDPRNFSEEAQISIVDARWKYDTVMNLMVGYMPRYWILVRAVCLEKNEVCNRDYTLREACNLAGLRNHNDNGRHAKDAFDLLVDCFSEMTQRRKYLEKTFAVKTEKC